MAGTVVVSPSFRLVVNPSVIAVVMIGDSYHRSNERFREAIGRCRPCASAGYYICDCAFGYPQFSTVRGSAGTDIAIVI